MRPRDLLVILGAAAALCLLSRPASGFDKRQSEIWRKLSSGRQQRLLLSGTSLSNIQYAPWPDSLKAEIDSTVGAGLLDLVNISPAGGNYSQSGANCADSAHRYIDLAPDAVFIEFASNDATNRYNCSVRGCSRPCHERLIDSLRTRLPACEIFLYITGRPWDKESCGEIWCGSCTVFEAQYCRRSAREQSNEVPEDYFAAVRELAEKYHTHLIDTYQQFRNIFDTAYAAYVDYLYDGHHPTPLATQEIIIPVMMHALRGWPLAITSPSYGDTFSVGDTMQVSWEYTPDSVNLIDVNVSVDSGAVWLPLSAASVPADLGSTRLVLPASIGPTSLTDTPLRVQVVQYNGTTADDVGPVTVLPRNAVRRGAAQRNAAQGRTGSRPALDVRRGRLLVTRGIAFYDTRGRALPAQLPVRGRVPCAACRAR